MHKPDGECIHTNVTGFSRRPIDNGDSYDVLHSLAPDLINRNVHNKGNDIYIESKLTTTTLSFGGVPQWGCSDQWLYRLTPTMLMRGRFEYGNYVESPVTTTLENQTRFWVGYNDMVLGFMRIFGGYQYFVVTNGNMYTTKVPNVPGKIIEQDAKFSGDKCLLLMKTLYKGRTYSYMYLLNGKGEILTERSEESLNSDLLRNIYGKELVGSTILHPTDDGIVMEKGSTITLKSATEPYVNSGCRLLMYKHGILVIDRQQIKYLTLS